MKVYVVIADVDYEGSLTLGVFGTEEMARQETETYIKQQLAKRKYLWADNIGIYAFELDKMQGIPLPSEAIHNYQNDMNPKCPDD